MTVALCKNLMLLALRVDTVTDQTAAWPVVLAFLEAACAERGSEIDLRGTTQ